MQFKCFWRGEGKCLYSLPLMRSSALFSRLTVWSRKWLLAVALLLLHEFLCLSRHDDLPWMRMFTGLPSNWGNEIRSPSWKCGMKKRLWAECIVLRAILRVWIWKDQSENALLKMEQSKSEKHRILHLNNTYSILQESEFISDSFIQQSCDMLLIFFYREFHQKNNILSGFDITLGRSGFTCGKRKEERFWILFLYLVQQNCSREERLNRPVRHA